MFELAALGAPGRAVQGRRTRGQGHPRNLLTARLGTTLLLFLFLFSHNTEARSCAVSYGMSFPAVLSRPRGSWLLWLVALFFSSTLPHPQPAHAQDTTGSNPSSSNLHGTVINSVTREAIGHALVFSPDNRLAAFTDDQGHFELQLPRIESSSNLSTELGFSHGSNHASIQLMARKPGFIESNWQAYQPQDALSDDTTIALVPESLIVGRVNLPSSNQSDRITVEVYKRQVRDGRPYWGPAASTTTRSSGEFRVANLAAGTYKVFTDELLDRDPITFNPIGQLYGYSPIYYPAAGDFASASPIILEPGKTFQIELSPVLRPYFPVKIAIANMEGGSPVNVSVALEGHKGPGYSLGYTGDPGIEGMLPNGNYSVEATLQQGQQTATGIANITVKDASLTHTSIAVVPNGSIPVTIKNELSGSGQQTVGSLTGGQFSPARKADVSLQPADDFDAEGFALRPPRRPNDNDLVLENVRPGRYWLTVEAYSGYVASAVAGSVDLLRQPLVVGPGGASLPVEVVLRDDGGSIEGTVEGTDPAAAGVRSGATIIGGATMISRIQVPTGPYVYCVPLPDSPGRFVVNRVSSEGTFQFQQLPPGVYRILAFDRQQGELEYHNADAMSVYESKGPVVRLAPGQTEQVRVTLISTKE